MEKLRLKLDSDMEKLGISYVNDVPGRLKVYKSFISANFAYCPVTWLFCGKVNSKKLEKLQEKALRLVYTDHVSSYSDLLIKAGMLSLSMQRLRFLAIEVYKCIKDINPKYLNDLFTKKTLFYDFRDTEILVQPDFNTVKFGYRSFSYYGAKLWNSLPICLKQAENLMIFKTNMHDWCRSDEARRLEIF